MAPSPTHFSPSKVDLLLLIKRYNRALPDDSQEKIRLRTSQTEDNVIRKFSELEAYKQFPGVDALIFELLTLKRTPGKLVEWDSLQERFNLIRWESEAMARGPFDEENQNTHQESPPLPLLSSQPPLPNAVVPQTQNVSENENNAGLHSMQTKEPYYPFHQPEIQYPAPAPASHEQIISVPVRTCTGARPSAFPVGVPNCQPSYQAIGFPPVKAHVLQQEIRLHSPPLYPQPPQFLLSSQNSTPRLQSPPSQRPLPPSIYSSTPQIAFHLSPQYIPERSQVPQVAIQPISQVTQCQVQNPQLASHRATPQHPQNSHLLQSPREDNYTSEIRSEEIDTNETVDNHTEDYVPQTRFYLSEEYKRNALRDARQRGEAASREVKDPFWSEEE